MEVIIRKGLIREIEDISQNQFPNEACGLLLGEKLATRVEIKEIREAENVFGSSTTFEIDPKFVVNTLEEKEEEDEELVGFFHSHPGLPAFISSRDEKFMELWLDKVWMIAGTDSEGDVTEVKAFRKTSEGFKEIEINLTLSD